MIDWILNKLGIVMAPEWFDIEFTSIDQDNVG